MVRVGSVVFWAVGRWVGVGWSLGGCLAGVCGCGALGVRVRLRGLAFVRVCVRVRVGTWPFGWRGSEWRGWCGCVWVVGSVF